MSPITAADQEAMIQATGGVTVVHGSETTYGHEELVSWELQTDVGAILSGRRSVVIADGRLSGINARKGIGESVVVNSTARRIAQILPGDDDGGLLRLMLAD